MQHQYGMMGEETRSFERSRANESGVCCFDGVKRFGDSMRSDSMIAVVNVTSCWGKGNASCPRNANEMTRLGTCLAGLVDCRNANEATRAIEWGESSCSFEFCRLLPHKDGLQCELQDIERAMRVVRVSWNCLIPYHPATLSR